MTLSTAAAMLGLGTGIGVFLLWWACWAEEDRPKRISRSAIRLRDMLNQAGLPHTRIATLGFASTVSGAIAFVAVAALSGSPTIAGCFGLFGFLVPFAIVRHRAQSHRTELRGLWPEAIDHLSSGIRAGLSLPEAMTGLSERGPEPLRPHFAYFAYEYRASGSFVASLTKFKNHCSDPVADRIVEALVITRQVGGTDLGTMLRTLSGFLRDDARTRSELDARQQWTITGARLAVAAPWIILALLSTRPEAAAAYTTASGAALLMIGLVFSAGAYRLMKMIGRLPEEPRVLR